MAFVTKQGSRYAVRKGNSGEILSTWSTKEAADRELRRLHSKYDPERKNRGVRARDRELPNRRR